MLHSINKGFITYLLKVKSLTLSQKYTFNQLHIARFMTKVMSTADYSAAVFRSNVGKTKSQEVILSWKETKTICLYIL